MRGLRRELGRGGTNSRGLLLTNVYAHPSTITRNFAWRCRVGGVVTCLSAAASVRCESNLNTTGHQ